MCGISGYINFKKKEPDPQPIKNMIDIMYHRGPDDEGICAITELNLMPIREQRDRYEESIGYLGFKRLSILDTSLAGHQPMINKDNTVAIIFNGEIYNAFDYKKELIEKGYEFNSNTDTEIVLNLYLEYGITKTLSLLNGMFAFAVCDLKKKIIYLARDRFGIKPVYLYHDKDIFIFASEIKSITASKKVDIYIDEHGYREMFVFGNSYNHTFIKGIRPLQPGQYVEVSFDGKLNEYTFFDLNQYKHPMTTDQTFNDYKEEAKEVISNCIKRQMISDVKLGCQLSGGIDSSLVTFYASELAETSLEDVVSVVFEKKYTEYNEEKYIDLVSDQLHLQAHKTELTPEFFVKNLEHINWHLDSIPAYQNELAIMLLSAEAKKHVTVLLSGEGADEVFAGYTRMAYSKLIDFFSRKPWMLNSGLREKIWKGRKETTFDNYVVFREAIPWKICLEVFSDYSDKIADDRIECLHRLEGSPLDKQSKYEMKVRLQGLLNRQDKSTMANSIENRVPFLDNEMVEWAYRIPEKYLIKFRLADLFKTHGTRVQGKFLLKSICSDLFGKNFAFRNKGGFGIPVADYIKIPVFKTYFYETILPGIKKRRLMNYSQIKDWYENISVLNINESSALWRCINLEIGMQLFVDGREPLYIE